MPKPGYDRIIVKREVKELLEKVSAELGFRTPNQLLEAILREQFLTPRLRVHPGVHPTWQNIPPQTEPILSPVSKTGQFSWSPGRDLNPRPAAYKAAALTAKPPGLRIILFIR